MTMDPRHSSQSGSAPGAAGALGAHGIEPFEYAYHELLRSRPGILASEAGGELAWLRSARERDALRWRKEGLPTRRHEDWKYVSLGALTGAQISLSREFNASTLPDRGLFATLPVENSVEIVFLNGHFVRRWSKLPTTHGLKIEALSEILTDSVANGWSAERLRKFASFKRQVETSDGDLENVFSALNTSFMADALIITCEKSTVVTDPVVIYHFTSTPGLTPISTLRDGEAHPSAAQTQMSAPRIFINVENEAELALLEVFASEKSDAQLPKKASGNTPEKPAYLNTCVTDVRVGAAARLSYAKVQLEGSQAYHLGTTRIHQERDSWVETQQFSFGAQIARHDLHLSLEGQGAEARADGLYLTDGTQVIDNHTSIEHLVPNTLSAQLYKGILLGNSRAVFNGRVKIHKDAQKSNSSQLNNNLMLSSKAEVDTKPQLEIFADDVKAAHGATIGQMDPEHLFYLQSRAISKDQAVQMLSRGFALEVVYRIENHELRRQLLELVTREMDRKVGGLK